MKQSTITCTLTGLGLIALTTLLARNTQAAPLVNEAFDEYANGTTLDSTGNWTVFSPTSAPYTQPFTVQSGTVSVSDVTTGTSPAVSGEDDRITFASSPQTGVLYYSVLVTVPTASTFSSTAGDYFFSGYSTAGTGGGYLGRVFVAKSADGGVSFGLSNAGSTVASLPAQQSADLTLGQEYRLVLRIDPTAHTATLGVQLANATPYTADSQLTITGGNAGSIAALDSVAVRQGSIGNGSVTVDGLQVGTTLTDVSGITTGASPFFNAVPEPSTYAALGLGVLALLGVQRMRRRTA